MAMRYVSIRPDNIPSDGIISFKRGFPTLSFTIQAQNGLLDPETVRINGDLNVWRDNLSPPTPCLKADFDNGSNMPTMDNRLGIYNVMDQLIIRRTNRGQNQICEHIRHYPRYMSAMLGVGTSKPDLMTAMNETTLIMPNSDLFLDSVIFDNASSSKKKSFSCSLPCGFLKSGQKINLMESSFGTIQIQIELSPDQSALFGSGGLADEIEQAHYDLRNVELSFEVEDIPADQMSVMASQTSGQYEYNTISSLYSTINSTNAQIQFSLGLKHLQSVFMTFCPSRHINTLTANGNALTYPVKSDGSLAHFKRVYFLKGGQKIPFDYDIVTNIDKDGNVAVVDPQLLRMFVESILPDYVADRSSVSVENNNRDYGLGAGADNSYLDMADGGALFGIGCKMSQFNTGQDYSTLQFGVSLESDLTDDSPISVFLFFKAKAVLVWNQDGVQLLQ